ncbi:lipopolysaccharide biosynthesis glycosyltransferase [Weissella uvarum]|uniref:glycosyltransferase family 8 protein n=1 Tax=Weissella uvarum TaxID=1479233 RepID=UPI00195FD4E3|nr:glycosyltransferase family 8 protein [Weissella uvarum]MBM7617436.1 lipopolysaccharide biosynthesis glycosyltransferase [Weissella uvarum]MCM0595679.1 glycosyltransferase family 8 protein [Weissella uvarum]
MDVNLLFSIDEHFTDQLMTTVYSIYVNSSPDNQYHVYVVQEEELQTTARLKAFLNQFNMTYHPIIIDKDDFSKAPVSKRYPKSIYFRLLAHEYLPTNLDKILYLDADILCINDISEFYTTNIDNYLYAASMHADALNLTGTVNKIRLDTDLDNYYNSGVLLMNLAYIREKVHPEDIFNFIEEYKNFLLLPDQDVLNKLYGDQILPVTDAYYNYDVRKDMTYQFVSNGICDTDWVINNTVFLHYCGKNKPWHSKNVTEKYNYMYRHYMHQALKGH